MRFCETLQNFCEAAAAWRSKISQILDHDHVNDSSVDTRTHAKPKIVYRIAVVGKNSSHPNAFLRANTNKDKSMVDSWYF